ncbi:glycosyltransferase family protein [Enterobacter asburiae]|uniref:glycosyltransferase family 2 protein n=1 Tax=Enterobacter asburiae TaxID=61645 RepID=UPI001F2E6211|nr:glycosyltransferase family 2 protein [Enterobacter asburiae]
MISINLTTTSSRLGLCSATVWSLINQKKKPDRIVLWISKEAYLSDDGVKNIPEWVYDLNRIVDIIDVRFVENTGPYRKIINALIEAEPSDVLVYADDDVIYGELWLDILLNAFYANKESIAVASRIRLTKKNIIGKMQSYSQYNVCLEKKIFNNGYIITGVGGCVLNKNMIKESLLTNKDYISLAPRTDDIWISKILELSNTKVEACPDALNYVQEIMHKNNALSLLNTYQFKNNNIVFILLHKASQRILSYFGMQKTNNDLSIKKVSSYFNKIKF